jgi:DNA (cytosine-5)-methyltransferase 1
MTHGSLFSGIGGFDLAAEWMGWENKFHCEWNEFCKKILKYYWPHATSYGDIDETDFTIWRGLIDVLSGGFPCQPYSTAGKRKGKEDDRHKWPQMLRAIREIQPGYVVGENVRGLTNWNGGLVFDEVQADLEAEGYEVLPFLLPACAVNAPHRRDRIWFVAHAAGYSCGHAVGNEGQKSQAISGKRFNEFVTTTNTGLLRQKITEQQAMGTEQLHESGVDSNTSNQGLQGSQNNGHAGEIGKNGNEQFARLLPPDWKIFPTQSPVCGGNDGIPDRVDRIKALGNAVVPGLVYEIFKAIENYENIEETQTGINPETLEKG